MRSYIFITLSSWLISCVFIGIASPLVDSVRTTSDDVNDAEIFKAVYNSIKEWEKKKKIAEKSRRTKREEATVCYADLGCFEASGPFSYLEMLPSSPDEISTKFLMFPSHKKRRNGMIPAEITYKNITEAFEWAYKGFNSSLPTKVMIHGFGSDCSHVWVYEMRSALMAVEEMNLICVDWSNGAILPNYVKAAANTRLVGRQVSTFLKGLIEENGLSMAKLHLIGFSLGAHVAGFAGAELGNLSRITGLDPAGPLFESQDPRARLDQTDADFVDVIHSNGENLILGGLGSWQPMGHVDFYPNGGRMQKGCTNLFVGAFTDIIWSSPVEGRSLCNHRRAYKFFTDSVSPRCHFPAFPCNTYDDFLGGNCFPCNDKVKCGNMGYYADRSKGRGQLYLITRDEEPFCAHQYLIKIESSQSDPPITSYGKLQITLIGDSFLNETFTLTKKDDEEMKLGMVISKIIVPHPILLEPAQILIHYKAYSGWLSSGLSHWKIDKITLSDAFGKTLSVCKKNLILESEIPVTLRLYPGECNLPKDDIVSKEEDTKQDQKKESQHMIKFAPTPVVKIGMEILDKNSSKENAKNLLSIKDAIEIFNLPWGDDKDNRLEDDMESSRAFNTRIVSSSNNSNNLNQSEIIREVMEPILKPQSSKHGRSHDPQKGLPEISEPILGPSNNRKSSVVTSTSSTIDSNSNMSQFISKDRKDNKDIIYNFYDLEKANSWGSTNDHKSKSEKWKRQDDSKVPHISQNVVQEDQRPDIHEYGVTMIVKTVQFLPQRLARMFEEAEKYAKETILPLVSTYTPKFLSDFIAPVVKPKYVPFNIEMSTVKFTEKGEHKAYKDAKLDNVDKSEVAKTIRTVEQGTASNKQGTESTSYQNIQKIPLKEVKLVQTKNIEAGRSAKDNKATANEKSSKLSTILATTKGPEIRTVDTLNKKDQLTQEAVSKSPIGKRIYIDLPVFEDSYTQVKYIPLNVEKVEKTN